MALICGDGFDHYPTALLLSKWDAASGTVSSSYGRLGSQGVLIEDGGFSILGQGGLSKNLPAANAAYGFVGTAMNIPSMPISGYLNLHAAYSPASGSAMHICSMIGADGSLAIGYCTINNFSFGVTVLATSAPGLITAGAWRYLETSFKIANSGGAVAVRLDGVEVVTFSGDTCGRGDGAGNGITQATTENFTNLKVGGKLSAPGTPMWFDDFYYCDDTGVLNNSFLGDVQLQAIYPDGAGNSTQWTPSAGNNWSAVDETSPDDDTTYVQSNTVNHLDMYTMQNISATATNIRGLLINCRIKKDDATPRTYSSMVKDVASAGANTAVATRSAPGGYVNQQDVSQASPATGTYWTVAQVNAIEAGVKVVS